MDTVPLSTPSEPERRRAPFASELPDLRLLEGWRAGDQRSGAALVSRYMRPLSRFFRNKLRNADDANDLVGETMVACVNGNDVIEGANFRRYLFGIAFNLLRKHYRTDAKRRRELSDFADICVGDGDESASPVTLIAKRDEVRLLARALRRIPLNQQIVLEMAFFEGLSALEISELTGTPESTVYTWQRRGKIRLAAVMRELADSREVCDSTMSCIETWAAQVRESHGRPATTA